MLVHSNAVDTRESDEVFSSSRHARFYPRQATRVMPVEEPAGRSDLGMNSSRNCHMDPDRESEAVVRD